ncbi:hypothetical protein ACJZ2D_016344 [Fusarium nematophilum]
MNRDGTCRISGYFYATEIAHLVPVSATGWFKSNCMNEYCRVSWDPQAINDERNTVVLRRDPHHLFDSRRITFIAKQLDNSKTANLVTHALLEQGSTELANLYQNRLTQPLTGISADLLFARLAWTIFSDEIFPFFSGMHTYNVRIFDLETGQDFDEHLQRPAIVGKLQLFDKLRSRSVSPSKRTNDQISQDGPGEEECCLEDINDMSELCNDDSQHRGRRRKRGYDWHSSTGLLSSASSASRSIHDLHETSTQVSSATEAGSVEHHDDQE